MLNLTQPVSSLPLMKYCLQQTV